MTRRLLVIGLALAALLLPLPPTLIERYYSAGLYPHMQSLLTGLSNSTSVAWFDILVVVVVGVLVLLTARDVRRGPWLRATGRTSLRLLTVGALLYLAFLAAWGLNYRREPLRRRIPYDASRVTQAAAEALARDTVTRLNALYAPAHAEGWSGPLALDAGLVDSFRQATRALGLPDDIRPGRPKHTLLDLYFRRAAVAGMTDPFFLETLVASDTLPFERPHVVAHEWAHLAGITDEGEANFVGWLACMRGSNGARYSGWLFLYSELLDGLTPDAVRAARAALAEGPRDDLRSVRARYEREVSPTVSGAGWRVYDSYLKANRVDAGTRSYAEVVQLVLGTEYREAQIGKR